MQHRHLAQFGDGVHRIQPQSVEAIFAQPVQCVLDGEGAHLRHAVIDRAAPWRLRLREEGRRILAEIISLGPEVVVDHIEKHHQPAQMRFVDQGFEIVGAAIGAVGRIPQHAVIAPVALTRKIGKRHQFQRGKAGRHQMIEPVDHGAIGALRREGSDMGFDQDGFLPRPSAPIPRAPLISAVVDHFARTGDVLRLECRGRIRNVDLIVNPEFIERAGLDAGDI